MPQPPEGMLASRISSLALTFIFREGHFYFFTVPTLPQEEIKIWYGKSQLGGKVSYYSDKHKLCASTHTSHVPPTFQSKTVLCVQPKQRSYVGHYPQTSVLPVGFRSTAALAGNFGSGHRMWAVGKDSDTPLCPGFPINCTRQLLFPLWDSHLPDLKH